MRLTSFLWFLPFVSFLLGYQLLRYVSQTSIVTVPSIVGLHMHDAIKILSADQLNVRILAEKEEVDMQEGIIISQTPHAGKLVKPHQSIFLVITKQAPKPQAPALFGVTVDQAKEQLKQKGVDLKVFLLESIHPEGTIFAQEKQSGQSVPEKTLSVLASTGVSPIRIMPSLKGRTVQEVQAFFKPYDIKIDVDGDGSIVTDQRPHAGTLISLKKDFKIQLIVAD